MCSKNCQELLYVKCIYGMILREYFFCIDIFSPLSFATWLKWRRLLRGGGIQGTGTNPGARWLDYSGTLRPAFCITGSSFVCELWSRCALDSSLLRDLLMASMSWHFKLRLLDFSQLMPWGIFLLMFQQQIWRKKRLLLKPMKCLFFFPNDWVSNKSLKKSRLALLLRGWFPPGTGLKPI